MVGPVSVDVCDAGNVEPASGDIGSIFQRQSDIGFVCSHKGYGFVQTKAFQCEQILAHGARWIAQGGPVATDGCQHGLGVDIDEVCDKGVRVLRHDGVESQTLGWKVPQVGCHNHIRTSVNRRRQDMTVVGVGQVKFGSEDFVSGHKCIGEVPVHDGAGPVQHFSVDVGSVGQ